MKVLIKGKDRVYRVDCDKCKAKLEYDKSDVKSRSLVPDREKFKEYESFYVVCPECKRKVVIRS